KPSLLITGYYGNIDLRPYLRYRRRKDKEGTGDITYGHEYHHVLEPVPRLAFADLPDDQAPEYGVEDDHMEESPGKIDISDIRFAKHLRSAQLLDEREEACRQDIDNKNDDCLRKVEDHHVLVKIPLFLAFYGNDAPHIL